MCVHAIAAVVASLEDLAARAEALLASDLVTAPTRRALRARLDATPQTPRALDARRFAVLEAVAGQLVPLGALQARADLAGRLDAQLADGPGDGWRHADAPPDLDALRAGLDALEAHAGPGGFAALAPERQDALLAQGQAGGEGWPPFMPAAFADLLASLCHLAYAHPLVQLDIGYDGMADAHGFQIVDPAHV